jgi:multiple sugar transport system substrate-binding protein
MRIDMAWRKGFEKLHYLPLDPADANIASFLGTFLPSIKSVYCPDGSALYTLPFDPSIQMLFFRRDLFEDATIKRIYYEHNREDLKIPGNYDEYDHMTGFFASKLNADFPVECGATMVYGNEITAACEMLPRIKSMGGSIFDGAGRIDLLSPVFVGALEKYLTIRKYSTENVLNWWDDALNIFIQGRAAMTVIFINHVSRIIRTHDIDTSMRVGFAPVPGNYPLLGGGVIGMSKRSKKTACCIDFLKWLYSDGIANTITLLGGLSPCASVFSNEEILEIYPWLRNISEQFELGWRSSKSRLFPDFDNYKFEQIFGGAVRSAALGITGLREALESAQKECEKVFTQWVIY